MISRRNFMASLTAVTVGAGALSIPVKSLRDRVGRFLSPPRLRVESLRPESYAGLAGTHLTIRSKGGTVTRALLKDVGAPKDSLYRTTRRLNQMSLLFEVPANSALTDGVHRVEHPLAGSCDLYLSAVGPVGKTRQFEAAISRLA